MRGQVEGLRAHGLITIKIMEANGSVHETTCRPSDSLLQVRTSLCLDPGWLFQAGKEDRLSDQASVRDVAPEAAAAQTGRNCELFFLRSPPPAASEQQTTHVAAVDKFWLRN